MRLVYVKKDFRDNTLALIGLCNRIIGEYQAQGYDLTLRQLYYQLVARDYIPNRQKEYKRLGSIVSDARLAGLMDWDAIVDRTRTLEENAHWSSTSSIVKACAQQFRYDLWADQEYRPEVWIEKDALAGVLAAVCPDLDVAYFSCRGYTSQSSMWQAGQRFLSCTDNDQTPVVIHLGDHDPSGIDMTRDIQDRLNMFTYCGAEVYRVALNMNQVEEHKPPPNPAKISDSRFHSYAVKHGYDSWELDALDPTTLGRIIRDAVAEYRDDDKFNQALARQQAAREELAAVAEGMKNA